MSTGPPFARLVSNAGVPAVPTAGVRLIDVCADGILLKRVEKSGAEELVQRGWAQWRGTGRRLRVELGETAPLSSLYQRLLRKDGTRPLRADQTCRVYSDKQSMGDPRKLRDFIL